jgi:hypothetical protein
MPPSITRDRNGVYRGRVTGALRCDDTLQHQGVIVLINHSLAYGH